MAKIIKHMKTLAIFSIILMTLSTCKDKSISPDFPKEKDTSLIHQPHSNDTLITLLNADGKGNAYNTINQTLGGTAVETPDCSHPAFGPHIREEFNSELNHYVFSFYIHVTPDNDRCINFDRQRVEIKTYDQSPSKLKAFLGDTMSLCWKFKLSDDFMPSSDFTHIHQLKPVDGDDAMPMITLTLRRKSTTERLEVIHIDSKNEKTYLADTDLFPLKGEWIEVEEKMIFGNHGKYQLKISRQKDRKVLLDYLKPDIDLWRNGISFCRPKWGIYRSLKSEGMLKDEKVLFADFCIAKGQTTCKP